MKTIVVVLLFAGGLGASKSGCPLLTLRDDCNGRSSECWSPGEPDTDCPDNGICCFDGCVNVCGVPNSAGNSPTDNGPSCPLEYVNQEETVDVDMCQDVPGVETCTETVTQVCNSNCHVIEEEETFEEEVECCTKTRYLHCIDKPCATTDGHSVDVPTNEVVCKKSPGYCFNNPSQVCNPVEVEECLPVESEECKVVKKQTEWPTTTEECSTEYKEVCNVVYKEDCGQGGRFGGKNGCAFVPNKECTQEPVTSCKPVTTVTLEWEDVEECYPVARQECRTETKNKCELVDKQECIEEEDVCKTSSGVTSVFVQKNCSVVDRQCSWIDDVSCQVQKKPVKVKVPKKVCNDVCEPLTEKQCEVDEALKACRKVTKLMSYRVPVQRC